MAELATPYRPALDWLLGRRSCHKLAPPGPSGEELALILQAALAVPDFGRLRPFRFLAAAGEGLERLGQALQRAAIAAQKPPAAIERAPRMPLRAPLVIVAIARPKPDKTVPAFDQTLCAASTVLMMQLAARALGYGGVWRSGWPMHEPAAAAELGLEDGERIVGFLYLGKPRESADAARPAEDPFAFLRWL